VDCSRFDDDLIRNAMHTDIRRVVPMPQLLSDADANNAFC